MTDRVSTGDVIAFRLRAHHLTDRLSEDDLLGAAAACGVQNSPPGSALLALHARARNVTAERVTDAVEDASLLQTWCMRGSPFFFPTEDAPVFTTGVLPPTEEARRRFVLGADPSLEELGMRLDTAVELTRTEVAEVLSGRRLAIGELGTEIATRIARKLPSGQRDIWEAEGPYAHDQSLGEGIVHFCIRILTLERVVCFAPRARNKAPFVLVDEWLGRPIPNVDPEHARAELVRRYLRCYGPSTRKDFAAWVGVAAGDADAWWSLVENELTPVEFGGRSWLLTEDRDVLGSVPIPEGVRLLPPRDPYTQLRDRETIVEKDHHKEVWKTVGEPGSILANGKVAGIWRPRKSGRKLTITVETFDSLPVRHRKALQEEAEQVASLRGASSVDVSIDAS